MYIGVFGDSFCEARRAKQDPPRSWPWPIRLENKYEVENFAISGSGLIYSYYHYKINQHKNYDRVIFFASQLDRRWVNPHWYPHFPAGHGIEDRHMTTHNTRVSYNDGRREYRDDPAGVDFINELQDVSEKSIAYFGHDGHVLEILNNLILGDVAQHPNVLIIQNFDTGLSKYRSNELSMVKFSSDAHIKRMGKNPDIMLYNHLNSDKHKWFWKKIDTWIDTGEFSLTKEDYNDVENEYD